MAITNGDIRLQSIKVLNEGSDGYCVQKPDISTTVPGKISGMSNPAFSPDISEPMVVSSNEFPLAAKEKLANGIHELPEPQTEDMDSSDDEYDTKFSRGVASSRKVVFVTYSEHKNRLWAAFWFFLACLFYAYFVYAMMKTYSSSDEASLRLLVVTILVTVFVVVRLIYKNCMKNIQLKSYFSTESSTVMKIRNSIYWFLVIGSSLFIIIFIIVDIALDQPRNLISLLGMFVFMLIFFVFSKNPARVCFRTVFWGMVLQFYFALLILRTDFGFQAFDWLGNRVQEFLAHTGSGASFVFGKEYTHHFFAFQVLSVVVFFSSVISVLYYLGVMQFIIRYIAKFLAFCLGTSPIESLNVASNIFLAQTDASLIIRPFVQGMTKSELHAVCTGGFASVAGSTMAAYILMGIPGNHLLSAAVMSAPAALAMAKLLYPESKKSKTHAAAVYNMKLGNESNIFEAASNGAFASVKLVAGIAVNLIAFLSILEFLNQTLIWFGHRVNMYDPELTFRFVCSYAFYPIAWLLGTASSDIRKIAGLIGTKTFLNEFVAYAELGDFISNTKKYHEYTMNATGLSNGTTYRGDDIILNYTGETLKGGILMDRSIVISTYALCGFSNIGSIGIMIGVLGGMAPDRKKDVTNLIVRAMIAGNVACFMTACIAGLLYEEPL